MKKFHNFYQNILLRFLFIVLLSSGVKLISSASPTETPYEIIQIGNLADARATDISVVENIAYVISFSDGFSTFDVSDPTHPIKLDTYAPTNTYDPDVHGAHTFL